MKFMRIPWLGLGAIIGISLFATVAFAEGEIITTLLATTTKDSELLRISADGSDPIKSTATAGVSFVLSPIPATATISKATLRFAGASVKRPANPQLVNIFPAGSDKSIGSWTATSDRSVFQVSTEALRLQVEQAHQSNKELSLALSSRSRLSDWRYSSPTQYGENSANKPRLIIEYKPPQVVLDREQERDTTKTRWTFFPRANNVMVKPFLAGVKTIISNPVFYEDSIYLFAQPTAEKTLLYALNAAGGNRWGPKEIQIRPGSHALVTNAGRLYSVGENRLVIYNLGDLEKEGVPIKSVDIKDFKPALRPTLGADGSLYAMPSGTSFLYGFNSASQELWRYPSDDSKLKLAGASRITLSPDAGRYAYVLTKVGTQTYPARIDTATGSAEVYNLNVKIKSGGKETDKSLDLGFKGFHRPVAIKGPQQDYVFLSAYAEQNGRLLAHSGGAVIWWKDGPVSQPIVNKDQNVVAVQNGKVHVYGKFNGADDGTDKSCSSKDSQLAATSNLVLDGEDNLYFWNNGTLFGYTKACENFLRQRLGELPENLELMFSPDGTLYARTDANNLYTITPNQKELTLAQVNLQTDTIYSAETIKVAANVQVKSATKVFLKAQKSISIGPGFKVEKGATITARTGF